MKESYNNKSLVKITNNIFIKIKNWFLTTFSYSKSYIDDNIPLPSDTINSNIPKKIINNQSDFLNSIKVSPSDDAIIFTLQRKYENGIIKIEDISQEDYSKLENLYLKQIEDLEKQIKYKKSKLVTN